MNNSISVETRIKLPVDKVWEFWTTPAHIMQWNSATEQWCTPRAEVDLKEGGAFFLRMKTKDGSDGFDHTGKYDNVIKYALIEYTTQKGAKQSSGSKLMVIKQR